MKHKYIPDRKPILNDLTTSKITKSGEVIRTRLSPDIKGHIESDLEKKDVLEIIEWLDLSAPLMLTASMKKAHDALRLAALDVWEALK